MDNATKLKLAAKNIICHGLNLIADALEAQGLTQKEAIEAALVIVNKAMEELNNEYREA